MCSVTTVPGRGVLRDRHDRTISYHRIFLSHPDMWKSKSDVDQLSIFKSMYWMLACGHAAYASLLPLQLNPLIHCTFIMSAQLVYQECYHQLAHESVINTMVLSPEGRRLVTGSNDSTVLMWSTQSGTALCHIKAHSPILSLAWLRNSNGFLFGCKNGMLASVDLGKVWGSVPIDRVSAALTSTAPCQNNLF